MDPFASKEDVSKDFPMHLSLTTPLTIRHIVSRKPYVLLPVAMAHATPSTNPTLWRKFVKLGGRVLPISLEDTQRVREYMRSHGTEALSEDGVCAFTLNGDFLAECEPGVCGEPEHLTLAEH